MSEQTPADDTPDSTQAFDDLTAGPLTIEDTDAIRRTRDYLAVHLRVHGPHTPVGTIDESAQPGGFLWKLTPADLGRALVPANRHVTHAGMQAPHGEPADDESEKYPAHTVIVTRLPAGFDHQDRREHEYVVGNDVAGWTSHQVTHPDACHELPYGRPCWLDENWYEGSYRPDELEPGQYEATWVSQMVGDHHGEFSHTDEYVRYERTGDAPERPGSPEPSEGYSTKPPF